MEEKTCHICGRTVSPENVVIHRIIPEEVARQAGIFDFRTATLCLNCNHEIQHWYRSRVYRLSYDPGTKRFVPKTPAEMIKEYEVVYKAFAAYVEQGKTKRVKRERRKR